MYLPRNFQVVALLILCPCLGLAGQTFNVFPKPSGPFDVAINTMEFIDTSRLDPYAPSPTPRAIMVSAIYPLQHRAPSCRYPYMPPLTAAYEDKEYGFPSGSYESLFLQVGCRSNPLVTPVVLFSPAQGNTRLDYNLLISNIASYGFTVIMMDHPYDADIVEFPDGSYIEGIPVNESAPMAQMVAEAIVAIDVRVKDTTFVLNQLSNATIVDQLIPGKDYTLNTNSVAMFGHSFGGAAAASAMVNETRIKGGLSMDGALFGDVLEEGLDQPFLLFGHTNNTRFYDGDDPETQFSAATWAQLWSVLRGWKLELELAGSLHYTFSDFPVQIEKLGLRLNATEEVALLSGGEDLDESDAEAEVKTLLQPERGMEVVVEYVVAFLEFVLKKEENLGLKGPSRSFPEVTFI